MQQANGKQVMRQERSFADVMSQWNGEESPDIHEGFYHQESRLSCKQRRGHHGMPIRAKTENHLRADLEPFIY